MVSGAPVVLSLKTPDKKMGRSSSLRGVVPFCTPPFLLSMSVTKSSAFKRMPAGHPSITTPTDGPCDSPKMFILKMVPKLFKLFRFIFYRNINTL